jgi:hypothetical protein
MSLSLPVNIMRFSHVMALLTIAGAVTAPTTTIAAETVSPAPLASAAPATPIGVAMVSNSPGSITLAWYSSPDEVTGYNVYISHAPDGSFAYFTTVTERTVTHDNLAPGSSHYYKVSALRGTAESKLSAPAAGFTIGSWQPAAFPAKIARNMCLTLGAPVVSNMPAIKGALTNLTDGSDGTSCRLRKDCEIKIKLNPEVSIADAAYLIVHFRTDCGVADWSNDKQSRTVSQYVVIESHDSTDGTDGTWREVVHGTNDMLDGVIVLPNHKPRWVGLRSISTSKTEVLKKSDRRLMPKDLILARLEVFRSAPAGYRNDYWIFTGDSLVMQDMPASQDPARSAWFSDLVRQRHPDRYPIVVHSAIGGEMIQHTLTRTRRVLQTLSPDNGTSTPTATILCWETGYNDVGVGGSLGSGANLIPSYEAIQQMCEDKGLILVPARIQFSLQYLNRATLEPAKDTIFVNSLAVNLGGVDVFARNSTPYACDPQTHLPYADYWTYTRKNYEKALVKDGVHHTKEGSDGINVLWADAADKMIYTPQK